MSILYNRRGFLGTAAAVLASTLAVQLLPGSAVAAETVKLNVGVLPIANLAPLYLGMEQGFFAEEMIEVEPVLQAGGAAVVAALMAGEVNVGWSATTGTFIAAAQGLPIRVVAAGTISPRSSDDLSGQPMVVPTDSPIKSIKDVEGKSIAVNTRANLVEITVSASLEKAGIDPSKVTWVELPFPDMPAALVQKQVDIISAAEPFYTLVHENGQGRAIFDAFYEAGPGLPTGHWVAVNPYADEYADVLARFGRAVAKANTYANENPDAARAVIRKFTKIPPEVVDKINLSLWSNDVDSDGMKQMAELTRKYGPQGLGEVNIDALVLKAN